MGKNKKVTTNPAPKAYTVEELEQKIETAESKIKFISKRIGRIKDYLVQSQMELDALVSRRTHLEEELKTYSGFLAQVKYSLKAVFSGTDNEAKINQVEISKSLSQLEPLIADKEHEIKCFEEKFSNKKELQFEP